MRVDLRRRSEYVELKTAASMWVHLIEEGPEPFSPVPTVNFPQRLRNHRIITPAMQSLE